MQLKCAYRGLRLALGLAEEPGAKELGPNPLPLSTNADDTCTVVEACGNEASGWGFPCSILGHPSEFRLLFRGNSANQMLQQLYSREVSGRPMRSLAGRCGHVESKVLGEDSHARKP